MNDVGGQHDQIDDDPPVPLSFKVMIALAVLYLGWRLVEGIIWVADRVLW